MGVKMKHKIMLALVLLVVLAIGVTVSAQDVKTVKVGLSWNQYDVSLVYAWEAYMQSESVKQGEAAGLKFEWIINAADGDPARQAANIEDLINQGVDIIIARAEDSAAIGASARAAEEAGIPFVTFDRASKTTQPTAHVGGDSYAQAKTTAEAFAALLSANGVTGQCIELQGALTDENAVNRSVAWNEFDASSDVFQTIAQVPTEWDATLFLSGATNALQANPDANCMFLASDFAITSVQSALESAGRWAPVGDPNHMWLATQDLFPEALTLMEQGYVDVTTTYDAFAHAQEAVRVMVAILNGEDPGCSEKGCLVAGRVATPENVASLDNLWSRDFSGK
jgi:ABC-type sugar transport system substrate-binding protein